MNVYMIRHCGTTDYFAGFYDSGDCHFDRFCPSDKETYIYTNLSDAEDIVAHYLGGNDVEIVTFELVEGSAPKNRVSNEEARLIAEEMRAAFPGDESEVIY